MESRPAAAETALQNPVGVPQVPPDLINTVLPPDPLRMIFRALPASHCFIAPVCRRFRDLYGDATKEKKKKKHETYEDPTYKYSIVSEAALQLYVEEVRHSTYARDGKRETSMIGAGCGRTDWVERGGVFNENTCYAAATGGQLRVLQWLRARNCPWDSWTTRRAARNGHLKVLKWAKGEGCELGAGICYEAAKGGHFEVLKWAQGEGCQWDKFTCSGAAQGGHLEILKWARGEGCEWDSRTCISAALSGHMELLKWAISNGCPQEG
eukprot:CAMPEP_0194349390 /NCGR_PEP_ID=MMETSP0171-20130528/107064_1 /TAXON_ID=218684 /ORGANISM="Corethron pennatum, Strain L29A3" /LENGTH=266 /DNA_ID=CAMNT_0039116835 /DNA_START=101 /DNA_END=897 /DNA_ORIENTATION=-